MIKNGGICTLTQLKSKARQHRYQDRLAKASPTSVPFLVKAAERGYSLYSIIKQLNKLLDRYGSLDFETALKEALSSDVPHPNAVRLILERCREERHQLPPIAIELPDDDRVRELVVRPHDLKPDAPTLDPYFSVFFYHQANAILSNHG